MKNISIVKVMLVSVFIPGSYPTELNYLEVYPYDSWNSFILPKFNQSETIMPKELKITAGKTSAPLLLSESDLIGTMDRNGIGIIKYFILFILGTDATIHDHINTVIIRDYIRRTKDRRLEPSPLGIALISGFDSIGFSMSLSKPALRRQVFEIL